MASIMGAEIKDSTHVKRETPKATEKMNSFQFGSPSDYNHLSQEEKEELTRKMMSHWKGWASRSQLK